MERKLEEKIASLPSNLDEAAKEIRMPLSYGSIELDCYGGSEPIYSQEQMREMFKAGAEWMAGQGETFSQEIQLYKRNGKPYIHSFEVYDYNKHAPLFNPGEEVTIQVRKKQ